MISVEVEEVRRVSSNIQVERYYAWTNKYQASGKTRTTYPSIPLCVPSSTVLACSLEDARYHSLWWRKRGDYDIC